MTRPRRKLGGRAKQRQPYGSLIFEDLRSSGVDEIRWTSSRKMRVRVRRVLRADGEAGVAVAWPITLTPRAFATKCPEHGRAIAETDVFLLNVDEGMQQLAGGLRKFLRDSSVDTKVSRLNTAHWSLSIWPANHTRTKTTMVEFVSRQVEVPLVRDLMATSIPPDFAKYVPAIVDAASKFSSSYSAVPIPEPILSPTTA